MLLLTETKSWVIMLLYIETNEAKMELFKVIKELNTPEEINQLFNEILTKSEMEVLSKRWRILNMLNDGYTQREIAKELKVSLCKVTRGSKILKDKNAVVTKFLGKDKN